MSGFATQKYGVRQRSNDLHREHRDRVRERGRIRDVERYHCPQASARKQPQILQQLVYQPGLAMADHRERDLFLHAGRLPQGAT
jgi:hypothetical protein